MASLRMHIVDDNDNLLAYKDKSDIDFEHEIYRVSALWLTNKQGEILIAQRKISKDYDGGKWGPAVAGTVEEGEDYEKNIYKEAVEEIGLTGEKFSLGPKQHFTEPKNYFCQWYTAVVNREADSFVLQPEEVEAVAWISPSQLVEEVASQPDKYIADMPAIIKQFAD